MEQTTSKPKVLITIIHQGWIRPEAINMVLAARSDARADISIAPICQRPYENAINSAMQMAKTGGYDYWISFDHDNVPRNNPIDLIFMEKDIIGMPYPTFRYHSGKLEMAFLAMDKQPNGEYLDHRNTTGLQEVDAVASGAIMLSRPVIESGVMFAREWNDNGLAVRGIDFNFCDKAKARGFKVHAHYGYVASHFKEIDLLDVISN